MQCAWDDHASPIRNEILTNTHRFYWHLTATLQDGLQTTSVKNDVEFSNGIKQFGAEARQNFVCLRHQRTQLLRRLLLRQFPRMAGAPLAGAQCGVCAGVSSAQKSVRYRRWPSSVTLTVKNYRTEKLRTNLNLASCICFGANFDQTATKWALAHPPLFRAAQSAEEIHFTLRQLHTRQMLHLLTQLTDFMTSMRCDILSKASVKILSVST